MPTYLLKWDATRWDWRNLRDQSEAVLAGTPVTRVWPCGTSRKIFPGDRVFLLRVGREPRGIVASGIVIRGSFDSPNNEFQDGNRGRGSLCVELKFDVIVEPRQDCGITRAALGQGALAGFNWDVAASGTIIPDPVVDALEASWLARGSGGAGSAAQAGIDNAESDRKRADVADAAEDQALIAAEAEAAHAAEVARVAAEKADAARATAERAAAEKAAAAKAAADKLAAENAAAVEEAAVAERVAKAAADKLAAEKSAAVEKSAATERAAKAAADKLAAEKSAAVEKAAAAERVAKTVAEKLAAEKAAAGKASAEKAAKSAAASAPTKAPAPPATAPSAKPELPRGDRDTGDLTAPTPAMYPAIVSDYFEMLRAELRGEMFSKADHRHRLAAELGLTDPDLVDLAFQQVSSALLEMGMPVVDGFRPLNGWPVALASAVQGHLEARPVVLDELWIVSDASKVAVPVELDDSRMVLMPTPLPGEHDSAAPRAERWTPPEALDVDFRAREARDEALTVAGQRFVLAYERARLRETGFKTLVGKIEWVAQDRGDAFGFHVRSYDEQGEPRSIIVKTTNYGARLPFALTAAELALGLELGSRVCIYRVYGFSRQPRLFVLPGPFESRLTLVPLEHRAVL